MSPEQDRSSAGKTRRQLLSMGGVALATSLSALSSGCLSSLPPLGGTLKYGRIEAPSVGEPTYRRWLPAPTSVDPTVEEYACSAIQPASPRPHAPELFNAWRGWSKSSLDYFGIGFQNYDQQISSPFGDVIEATFERKAVTQTAVDSGYERTGKHRGYTVLDRSDSQRRVAIGDDAIVWASEQEHDRPNIEALIDTAAGKQQRYHETSTKFNRLTTAAGGPACVNINTHSRTPGDRPAMLADAIRFDADTAYRVVHYLYKEHFVDPSESKIKAAHKENNNRFTGKIKQIDVQLDGKLATLQGKFPSDSADGIDPKFQLPQVTWSLTHNDDAATVTVRHKAGESVPANRLYYNINYTDDGGKVEKQPLWTDAETVSAGSETVIDVDEPNAAGVYLIYSVGGVHFEKLSYKHIQAGNDVY